MNALRPRLIFPFAAVALLLAFVTTAPAQSASIIANAPVKNFRLPSFNDDGHRTSLLRGGEARYISATQIDVLELNYTQFLGDGSTRSQNILLAPSASVLLQEKDRFVVSGREAVRLISDQLEASGRDWLYEHAAKKLLLRSEVRVIFRQPLGDILK
jgi:hypothetical protein